MNLYLRRITFLLIALVSFVGVSNAQKYFQVEKTSGKVKYKLTTGDIINFRMATTGQNLSGTIFKIDNDLNLIQIEGLLVNIKDIDLIYGKEKIWNKVIGGSLLGFGLPGMVFSVPDIILDRPQWKRNLTIVTSSALVGYILTRFKTKNKKYHVGKKYRIRLVDTNFYPPMYQ